jgi:hypothetical protein
LFPHSGPLFLNSLSIYHATLSQLQLQPEAGPEDLPAKRLKGAILPMPHDAMQVCIPNSFFQLFSFFPKFI